MVRRSGRRRKRLAIVLQAAPCGFESRHAHQFAGSGVLHLRQIWADRPATARFINHQNTNKMQITGIDILVQVERLAAACPWDKVDLWVCRAPEGNYDFTAYIPRNSNYGFLDIFGRGATPEEAVNDAIKQAGLRDPDSSRRRKIEELKEQIEKLQAVVIGLPPYRPNRELSNGEPAISVRVTLDV